MSKKHGSKDFRFQREFAGKCERYYGSVAAYAETLSDDKSYRLESKKAYKKNSKERQPQKCGCLFFYKKRRAK